MRISFLSLGAVLCKNISKPGGYFHLFISCVCVSIGEFQALGCVARVG